MAGGNLGGGTGETNSPYIVEDKEDFIALIQISDTNTSQAIMNIDLKTDIDLSGMTFNGLKSHPSSHFNGNSHIISNATFYDFFMQSGSASNLLLESPTVLSGNSNSKSLMFSYTNTSYSAPDTYNVHIRNGKANISGSFSYFGGLSAAHGGGNIKNVFVEAEIILPDYTGKIGGLFGNQTGGSTLDAMFKGTINAPKAGVGGAYGWCSSSSGGGGSFQRTIVVLDYMACNGSDSGVFGGRQKYAGYVRADNIVAIASEIAYTGDSPPAYFAKMFNRSAILGGVEPSTNIYAYHGSTVRRIG